MQKILLFFLLTFSTATLFAQLNETPTNKLPIYSEIGLGAGQTLFFNQMSTNLGQALGGHFTPGISPNLMMGFYIAPQSWKGLGLGSRIHGTFGMPIGPEGEDQYVFNYYNLALSLQYYLSQTFNRGLYGKASLGFGQMTAKRLNEARQSYQHQYAIGSSITANIGYTLPINNWAVSLELHFSYAARNGTVTDQGDGVLFESGQLGVNVLVHF